MFPNRGGEPMVEVYDWQASLAQAHRNQLQPVPVMRAKLAANREVLPDFYVIDNEVNS